MKIVRLTSEFHTAWNRFCGESDEAWFWHTTEWLEYTLAYRPDLKPESHAFLVMREDRLLAICPLILQTREGGKGTVIREFSDGTGAGPAPALANGLSERVRKEVLAAVCRELDSLAERLEVAIVNFRESPPSRAFWSKRARQPHPLTRYGFLDTSLATQVLDLSRAEPELLKDMRKGHQYDVKRSQKLVACKIYDRFSISCDSFHEYRELHRRAAGRVTRPAATFELMQRWIEEGMAILSSAQVNGRNIGFAFICVHKDGAYYGSGCEDPDFGELPIGHAMQWAAMLWLKQHGVVHYEVGLQPCGKQLHSLYSDKEARIALFKRGFGGSTFRLWAGEKYYSRPYYEEIALRRMKDYAESTFSASTVMEAEQ